MFFAPGRPKIKSVSPLISAILLKNSRYRLNRSSKKSRLVKKYRSPFVISRTDRLLSGYIPPRGLPYLSSPTQ